MKGVAVILVILTSVSLERLFRKFHARRSGAVADDGIPVTPLLFVPSKKPLIADEEAGTGDSAVGFSFMVIDAFLAFMPLKCHVITSSEFPGNQKEYA